MDVDHGGASSQPQSSQPDIVLWQGSQVKNAALDSLITEAKRPIPRPRRPQPASTSSWDFQIPALQVEIPVVRPRPPRSWNTRSTETSPATRGETVSQAATDPTAVLGLIKGVAAHLNSTTPLRPITTATTSTIAQTDPRRRSAATSKPKSTSISRVKPDGKIGRRSVPARKSSLGFGGRSSVSTYRSLPDLTDPGLSSLPVPLHSTDALALRAATSFSMDVDSGFYVDHDAESNRSTQLDFDFGDIGAGPNYVYATRSGGPSTRAPSEEVCEMSVERTETPPLVSTSFPRSASVSTRPSPEPNRSQSISTQTTPELVPTLILSNSSRRISPPVILTPPEPTNPRTTPKLFQPSQPPLVRPSQASGRLPVLGMRRTNGVASSAFTPSQGLPMRQRPFRTPFANGKTNGREPPRSKPETKSQPPPRQTQKVSHASAPGLLKAKSKEDVTGNGSVGTAGSKNDANKKKPATSQTKRKVESSDSEVEIVEESILPDLTRRSAGEEEDVEVEERRSSPGPADADSSFGHIAFDFEADELEEAMKPYDFPATA